MSREARQHAAGDAPMARKRPWALVRHLARMPYQGWAVLAAAVLAGALAPPPASARGRDARAGLAMRTCLSTPCYTAGGPRKSSIARDRDRCAR